MDKRFRGTVVETPWWVAINNATWDHPEVYSYRINFQPITKRDQTVTYLDDLIIQYFHVTAAAC